MQIRNEPNDAHLDDPAHDEEPLPPSDHPAIIAVGRYLSDTLSLCVCARRRAASVAAAACAFHPNA
jgi:hypothetical protein